MSKGNTSRNNFEKDISKWLDESKEQVKTLKKLVSSLSKNSKKKQLIIKKTELHMKKTIIVLLITTLSFITLHAQWQQVGDVGFSHENIRRHAIAVNSEGIPYVFYSTYDTPNEARVVKYNGTDWETVGEDDVTGTDYWWARDNSIRIDDNDDIYIAYSEIQQNAPYDYSCFVKKFNGSEWETIAEFITSVYSIQMDFHLSPDGTPYISYWDDNEGGAIVKKYNGATWDIIGDDIIAPGQLFALSFTVDEDENVWTAYADQNDSFYLAAKKFNGTEWVSIGTHLSNSSIEYPNAKTDIVIDNDGKAYIAAAPSAFLSIFTYDGTWSSNSLGDKSTFFRLSKVTDNNDIFLINTAYIEAIQQSNMSVRKKDNTENWNYVTGDQYIKEDVGFTHIDVFNNTLFALYRDEPNGEKSSVIKYDPTATISENINSQLQIIPNPSNGVFKIENYTNTQDLTDAEISITNVNGETFFNSKSLTYSIIDISSQPTGVYFITIKTGTSIFFEKLIIK